MGRDEEPRSVQVSARYRFPGAGFTSIGQGLALPGEYGLSIDDEALPYLVEMDVRVEDGKPTCEALKVARRPGGPPVTGEGIRKLPVAGFLRHTVQDVAYRVTETGSGTYKLEPLERKEMPAARQLYEATRRRESMSDERLQEAARSYREAERRGAAPAEAVRQAMFVSRSTAARLVRAAREKGLLPPLRRKERR